jgi:hypothetical protein
MSAREKHLFYTLLLFLMPFLLFGAPSSADLDCLLVKKVAQKVMTIRQSDLPEYLASEEAAAINLESLEDAMVIDAYRFETAKTKSGKIKKIRIFTDAYQAICIGYNLGLIAMPTSRKTGLDLLAGLEEEKAFPRMKKVQSSK